MTYDEEEKKLEKEIEALMESDEDYIPTPEEFKDAMEKLTALDEDKEMMHGLMDDVMCWVLRRLGYGEGVEIFKKTDKWYA